MAAAGSVLEVDREWCPQRSHDKEGDWRQERPEQKSPRLQHRAIPAPPRASGPATPTAVMPRMHTPATRGSQSSNRANTPATQPFHRPPIHSSPGSARTQTMNHAHPSSASRTRPFPTRIGRKRAEPHPGPSSAPPRMANPRDIAAVASQTCNWYVGYLQSVLAAWRPAVFLQAACHETQRNHVCV